MFSRFNEDDKWLEVNFQRIPYTWVRNEIPSKSDLYHAARPLAIQPSGRFSSYATSMCLNRCPNVDILHINYNYVKNEHFAKLSNEEQEFRWMYEDVKAVVEETPKRHQLLSLCFSIK